MKINFQALILYQFCRIGSLATTHLQADVVTYLGWFAFFSIYNYFFISSVYKFYDLKMLNKPLLNETFYACKFTSVNLHINEVPAMASNS